MSEFKGFGERKLKIGERNFKVKKKKRKQPILLSKNKDTIQELHATLKRQPKFTKSVVYCVSCLDKLAVDEVSAEELIMEGTVEKFMEILAKVISLLYVTFSLLSCFLDVMSLVRMRLKGTSLSL